MPFLLLHFPIIFVFMLGMFVIATYKKNNGLVDIGWGVGFVVVSLSSFFVFRDQSIPILSTQGLITLLVFLWGSRLAIHLFFRNWGKAEDWRYAKWRKDWGKWVVLRSFFQVFMLQGFFIGVILLPVLLPNNSTFKLFEAYPFLSYVLFILGVSLWVVGFFFQAISDYQLMQFKKNPENKGQVMRYGLWAYSRHPNYFGEATMWWGIYCISLLSCATFFDAMIRVVGPITIHYMLLKVSGVTMLESKYKNNKEYQLYQQHTSSFFPWGKANTDDKAEI